jgi:hypothetical protein
MHSSTGQLVAEYPFIYLMSKLHLTKFVGVTMYVLLHALNFDNY